MCHLLLTLANNESKFQQEKKSTRQIPGVLGASTTAGDCPGILAWTATYLQDLKVVCRMAWQKTTLGLSWTEPDVNRTAFFSSLADAILTNHCNL